MYENVLVPLDGSKGAEIALPYAEELSARLGAEITLVSVSGPGADTENLFSSYLERVAKQVEMDLKGWWPKVEAGVRTEVLVGKPADEIRTYADQKQMGLIVMASRGSSGHVPWLMGNTADKLLRMVDKPVLLVRSPAGGAALAQKSLLKKVLMPLDGSSVGETAIPYAEALAQAFGAELVFFHVLEPAVEPVAAGPTVAWALSKGEVEQRKAHAMTYLNAVAEPLKAKGLTVSAAVAFGSAASEIISFAEANATDLIAMSTHGRSGVSRWVFGSVTDKILHAGDKPVLTVRAAKV